MIVQFIENVFFFLAFLSIIVAIFFAFFCWMDRIEDSVYRRPIKPFTSEIHDVNCYGITKEEISSYNSSIL